MKRHRLFDYAKAKAALEAGGFMIDAPTSASMFWLFLNPTSDAGKKCEVAADVRGITARRLRGSDKLEKYVIPPAYRRVMRGWHVTANYKIYMLPAAYAAVGE